MPAKKADAVVRTRYICPITNTPKFLQTKVNMHASRKDAKEFLDRKKKKILENKFDPDSADVENIEPEEPKEPEMIKLDDADGMQSDNLMNIPVESSAEIDRIYESLQFSPFKLNMDITADGHSISIFGSSKSGKTTLLKNLLKKYVTNKKSICVLSAQNAHSKAYKDYPKEIILTDNYSPILVKAAARINKKSNNKYPICFVLDDIIDAKNDRKLEDIYLTLRNSLISIIVLIQNVQLLRSTSRSNSNIVIFKKFNNPKTIEDYVMKEFLGNYPPFRDLRMNDKVNLYFKIMNDGNYNFFVLDVLENTLILCKGTDLK